MSPKLLARVGLARLRLPSPSIKMEVITAAAAAIQNVETREVAVAALIEEIRASKLESESLEALSVFFLTGSLGVENDLAIRTAVRYPSILSEIIIQEALRTSLAVPTWVNCHSGTVPEFHNLDALLEELERGDIVPPILKRKMRALGRELGTSMLKQWAYEMECLVSRAGDLPTGHWMYFSDSRDEEIRAYIPPRSHLARSAYLRALAYAFDVLDARYDTVRDCALATCPIDFFICRMGNGSKRQAPLARLDMPHGDGATRSFVEQTVKDVEELHGRDVWHLSSIFPKTPTHSGEFDVATVVHDGPAPEGGDASRSLDAMLGRLVAPRQADHSILVPQRADVPVLPSNGGCFVPALIPVFGSYAGYLHSELISRPAFLPTNLASKTPIAAKARAGGAAISVGGDEIGSLEVALRDWRPSHSKGLGGNSVVLLSLVPSAKKLLLGPWASKCTRVWSATVRTRTKDYGDWITETFAGELPFSTGQD